MEFGTFVYILLDRRTGKFRPQLFVSVLDAEHYAVSWKDSYVSNPPETHEPYVDVYQVGELDIVSGLIKALPEKVLVIDGLTCEFAYNKFVQSFQPQLDKVRGVGFDVHAE